MKAVELCGGKGARLRPYTDEIPKPMLPLGKKPILQYILENARRNGIEEVFLTIGYKKDHIKEYFEGGELKLVFLWYACSIMTTVVELSLYKGTYTEYVPFLLALGSHLCYLQESAERLER